jgi:hypothetical protein
MNKTSFTLRIGACITVIGIAMVLATMTIPVGNTFSLSFTAPANGDSDINIVAPVFPGHCEIRVSVSRSFEGTLYMFDYDGMRGLLTEGNKMPILEEDFKGPTLIDFNLTEKGAYLFMVESHVSTSTQGTIGLIEKEAVDQDLLQYSIIIAAIGLATSLVAGITKTARSRVSQTNRNRNEITTRKQYDAHVEQ